MPLILIVDDSPTEVQVTTRFGELPGPMDHCWNGLNDQREAASQSWTKITLTLYSADVITWVWIALPREPKSLAHLQGGVTDLAFIG